MSEVTQTLIDDAQAHSQSESRITARDLRSVFWRSFTLQGSWNYERQQHMGYAFAMSPALKRIYQTPPNWGAPYSVIWCCSIPRRICQRLSLACRLRWRRKINATRTLTKSRSMPLKPA